MPYRLSCYASISPGMSLQAQQTLLDIFVRMVAVFLVDRLIFAGWVNEGLGKHCRGGMKLWNSQKFCSITRLFYDPQFALRVTLAPPPLAIARRGDRFGIDGSDIQYIPIVYSGCMFQVPLALSDSVLCSYGHRLYRRACPWTL